MSGRTRARAQKPFNNVGLNVAYISKLRSSLSLRKGGRKQSVWMEGFGETPKKYCLSQISPSLVRNKIDLCAHNFSSFLTFLLIRTSDRTLIPFLFFSQSHQTPPSKPTMSGSVPCLVFLRALSSKHKAHKDRTQ